MFILALAVGFLGLAGLSGRLALGEARAVRFAQTGGALPALALSLSADRALLTGCLRAASSVEGRLMQGRATLLTRCQRMAEAITATAPEAYGWAVLAYFRHENNDQQGFESALLASYSAGSQQGWVAALRVRLAERNFPALTPETRRGHRQDLALLVQSPVGRWALVRRYLAVPAFRARLSTALAAVPLPRQREFLAILRGAARGDDAR